jgi:hypothetical protein
LAFSPASAKASALTGCPRKTASAGYKKEMAAVFVRRALDKALADVRQQARAKAAAKPKAKKKAAKKRRRR